MADELHQRAAERYAMLIDQLGAAFGGAEDPAARKRGWQSATADALGVHRSYVSRIARGDRTGIGADVIARAIERVGLEPTFFYAHAEGVPRYVDYLTGTGDRHVPGNEGPRRHVARLRLSRRHQKVIHEWREAAAVARRVRERGALEDWNELSELVANLEMNVAWFDYQEANERDDLEEMRELAGRLADSVLLVASYLPSGDDGEETT